MNDKEIDYLEEQIPALAVAACKIAYWQALMSGHRVLIAENGEILEVFPDGTRKFVKKIDPPIKSEKRKLLIKR